MFGLAVPVVLAELGWTAMGVVDTVMVGRVSAEAIGAVGVGSILFYAVGIFGTGLLLGLDTLVPQAYGAGDLEDCHHTLFQAVYLCLGLAPILMILMSVSGACRRCCSSPHSGTICKG
jgi:MATE family multidrug resistance protein